MTDKLTGKDLLKWHEEMEIEALEDLQAVIDAALCWHDSGVVRNGDPDAARLLFVKAAKKAGLPLLGVANEPVYWPWTPQDNDQ